MIEYIINKLWAAGGYSYQGLRFAISEEFAFRLEIAMSVVLIPLALWLGQSPAEKSMMLFSWLSVLVVELLNSAIENAINRVGPEMNPFSQRAKDMGSAAVFVAGCITICVWLIILI